MRGVFITGTDTGVGKTWVGCMLARSLRQQGIRVIPRKPVESGCSGPPGNLVAEDALLLKQAADYPGSQSQICPWPFQAALSPQRAANLENRSIHLQELTQACQPPAPGQDNDFLLVEGAGGFYSPICQGQLNADLAEALQLPILLVAEDRLGCISQVLLSAEAIQRRGLTLSAVVLNQHTSATAHASMDNLEDLREWLPLPITLITSDMTHTPANLLKALVGRL